MITKTSETAIRALLIVAAHTEDRLLTPREISDRLRTSPTYMAKICGLLVKANLLRSQRGASGGVQLARMPSQITLRHIVEACEGLIVGAYCEGIGDHPEPVCSFHTAMVEAHKAVTSVLAKWTLAELMRRPGPASDSVQSCKMGFVYRDGALVCVPAGQSPPPQVPPTRSRVRKTTPS